MTFIESFFDDMSANPNKKAEIYSVNKMTLNKNYVDDDGEKVPNPFYNNMFSNIITECDYSKTYYELKKEEDPDYVPSAPKNNHVRIKDSNGNDYKFYSVNPDTNERYINGIKPITIDKKILYMDDDGKLVDWDTTANGKYTKYMPNTKYKPSGEVLIKIFNESNIYKIVYDDVEYINPDFKYNDSVNNLL